VSGRYTPCNIYHLADKSLLCSAIPDIKSLNLNTYSAAVKDIELQVSCMGLNGALGEVLASKGLRRDW